LLQQCPQAWEILSQNAFDKMDEAFLLPEYEMRVILLPEVTALILQSLHGPIRIF
jgi:hypothetical protein